MEKRVRLFLPAIDYFLPQIPLPMLAMQEFFPSPAKFLDDTQKITTSQLSANNNTVNHEKNDESSKSNKSPKTAATAKATSPKRKSASSAATDLVTTPPLLALGEKQVAAGGRNRVKRGASGLSPADIKIEAAPAIVSTSSEDSVRYYTISPSFLSSLDSKVFTVPLFTNLDWNDFLWSPEGVTIKSRFFSLTSARMLRNRELLDE
jgi:hypothetical protein